MRELVAINYNANMIARGERSQIKFRRVMKTEEYLREIAKQYNERMGWNCYASLYELKTPIVKQSNGAIDYEACGIIDKLYFDFDEFGGLSEFESFQKAFNYLYSKKIHFWCTYTGNGFHFYFSQYGIQHAWSEYPDLNINDRIKIFLKYLVEDQIGIECDLQSGGASACPRLVWSINHKYFPIRWCIPLTKHIIDAGEKKIKELSANPEDKWGFQYFGNKRLNLTNLSNDILDEYIEKLGFDDQDEDELNPAYAQTDYDLLIKGYDLDLKHLTSLLNYKNGYQSKKNYFGLFLNLFGEQMLPREVEIFSENFLEEKDYNIVTKHDMIKKALKWSRRKYRFK